MPHLFYGMEIVMDRKSIKIKTFQFSLSQIYTIGIFPLRKSAKCSEMGINSDFGGIFNHTINNNTTELMIKMIAI